MDAIMTALREQVSCYERLAKLADQQREHVRDNRTEALLDVLGRRQIELDRIAGFERDIAPAKRRWTAYLAELPDGDRAAAGRMMDSTRRLLEHITNADREDAMMLQQRKLNLGRQIDATRSARQINRNYAAAAYGRPAARLDVGG